MQMSSEKTPEQKINDILEYIKLGLINLKLQEDSVPAIPTVELKENQTLELAFISRARPGSSILQTTFDDHRKVIEYIAARLGYKVSFWKGFDSSPKSLRYPPDPDLIRKPGLRWVIVEQKSIDDSELKTTDILSHTNGIFCGPEGLLPLINSISINKSYHIRLAGYCVFHGGIQSQLCLAINNHNKTIKFYYSKLDKDEQVFVTPKFWEVSQKSTIL